MVLNRHKVTKNKQFYYPVQCQKRRLSQHNAIAKVTTASTGITKGLAPSVIGPFVPGAIYCVHVI